jgi:hypothetical protein
MVGIVGPFAMGDRAHGRPTDSGLPGNLPLRQIAFGQESSNFVYHLLGNHRRYLVWRCFWMGSSLAVYPPAESTCRLRGSEPAVFFRFNVKAVQVVLRDLIVEQRFIKQIVRGRLKDLAIIDQVTVVQVTVGPVVFIGCGSRNGVRGSIHIRSDARIMVRVHILPPGAIGLSWRWSLLVRMALFAVLPPACWVNRLPGTWTYA